MPLLLLLRLYFIYIYIDHLYNTYTANIYIYHYEYYKHFRSNFVAQAFQLLQLFRLHLFLEPKVPLAHPTMPRDLEITWGLVVNGRPVPAEMKRMSIIDPYQLAQDLVDPRELGPLDVVEQRTLVDFKATGDVIWLEDALNLEHRTWKSFQKQIPLLTEIKHLVQGKRVTRGGISRAPRQSQDGK